MIRLIAHLLILSLLTLNISWAADACALTDPASLAHADASLQVDDQSPLDTPSSQSTCDDWCHAWVGHVAAINLPRLPLAMTGASLNFTYVYLYSSLITSPPFHPPIA